MIALAVARPSRKALWLPAVVLAMTAVAWLTCWFLWGKAFDYPDTGETWWASIEVALNAAIAVCAAGCVALVASVVRVIWSARRPSVDRV